MTTIRAAVPADAAAICDIYNHYVANTVVTFEETPVPAAEMSRRIAATLERFPWLVAEQDDLVLGYAYASTWKTRASYRFSVETTVYLRADVTGRGYGHSLYSRLIGALRGGDLHSVIGGIALPNPASVRLHEKLGFAKIGHFHEVGFKLGRWVDVGYWELLL